MIRAGAIAILLALLPVGGCLRPTGLIFTDVVEPLDVDLRSTPVASDPQKMRKGDMKHFRYYLEGEWDSDAITEIARENGIDEVLYADLETVLVLYYFRQEIVHIYGR